MDADALDGMGRLRAARKASVPVAVPRRSGRGSQRQKAERLGAVSPIQAPLSPRRSTPPTAWRRYLPTPTTRRWAHRYAFNRDTAAARHLRPGPHVERARHEVLMGEQGHRHPRRLRRVILRLEMLVRKAQSRGIAGIKSGTQDSLVRQMTVLRGCRYRWDLGRHRRDFRRRTRRTPPPPTFRL
jgi:hypothetical protein